MSGEKKARGNQGLVLGALPRASLLPPELKEEEKAKGVRRRLVAVIILVIVVVVGGYAFSAIGAEVAQQRLAAANNRTTELLSEQGEYIEVRQLADQVKASEEARTLAMATDADWAAYVDLIDASLLSVGASVQTFDVVTSTPFAQFGVSTSLLEGERVAEIKFSGASPSLPVVASWLRALEGLPGFVDAKATTVTLAGDVYTMEVVLHVNSAVYTNRFVPETESDATEETTTDEGGQS